MIFSFFHFSNYILLFQHCSFSFLITFILFLFFLYFFFPPPYTLKIRSTFNIFLILNWKRVSKSSHAELWYLSFFFFFDSYLDADITFDCIEQYNFILLVSSLRLFLLEYVLILKCLCTQLASLSSPEIALSN